ncbi:hypothetical protein H0B56_14320 [Haloechinothrix sp. YIM 98757]|uniref:Uncharacterized protein n=1 Tax=Haloechinothrix aidingensis TaxID=2752311 RepID=A0A838ABV3_9PSEU|nr:hypothetical protein [Haloechinothrix aidingensis]MBA0126724.1 hypothetical protein [Haloechinothrix aidingensis]
MASRVVISDAWYWAGVHWHGYVIARADGACPLLRCRFARLARVPDAVLVDPVAVADWIEHHTRTYLHPRQTWAPAEQRWVRCGDTEDLARSRRMHLAIASRGDSLYLDIPTATGVLFLFVEAVTDAHCLHPHTTDPDDEDGAAAGTA